MNDTAVTIVIPHYQTHDLIRICLRSIRKYTPQPYNVIVIDNGSRDESLEYLRSLKWITLIERNSGSIQMGSWAHGSALDVGLKHTHTEFFLALHSDVIVKDANWLKTLTAPFRNRPRLACVGSGKLEEISTGYRLFKKVGDVKGFLRFLRRRFYRENAMDKRYQQPPYIRTICALYRSEILNNEHLSFLPIEEEGLTSGQALYYELIQRGYLTRYLSSVELRKVIDHLNHGTMILNPFLGARKRTITKGLGRIQKTFREETVMNLLEDASLDQ